ncbi:BamA/OMP85 family outer membrane protein [Thermoflavifilum thermophilum]|uniref:Beta-barrel assembly machine subunit BamA n=1 Tax=Thermoflavifilum thermophilum TaxID=1393122 RepID=A0A1I7N6Y2_9BACT|nr:POTRA domain-containing protein [Thermoflavifilum thermophilum]SFV30428.1 Beta-barrel assembly machine subunit BamA [Thermoflavifilum thermophilum]
MKRCFRRHVVWILCVFWGHHLLAQQLSAPSAAAVDTTQIPALPSNPKSYRIAGITVSGARYLDPQLLVSVSGISVGDRIILPGDGLAKVIQNLWKQHLFSNIQIYVTRIDGDDIYLDIHVTERPRLANFYFRGVSKTEADELKTKTDLHQGSVVTDNMKINAEMAIRKYFQDKGYRNITMQISERPDTAVMLNAVDLIFNIHKGKKVKISEIFFAGNDHVPDAKLKAQMKNTKEGMRLTLHPARDVNVYGGHPYSFSDYLHEWGFLYPSKTLRVLEPYFRFKLFNSAKFNQSKYEEDKAKIIEYYNSLGYRDATIVDDTIYQAPNGNIDIAIKVNEGDKYYFGNITWSGNTKYPDTLLNAILRIHKGDPYNLDLFNKRLGITPTQQGDDISSLYLNDGYLFFRVTPVETQVYHDTIDYDIRITEGPQATINKVTISGNDRTNEHVIRRELRTIPGEKFSRADLIRSQRDIAQLGMFDPQKVNVNPQPNPDNGTVDIGWSVVEKPSDQLELSAGWGGYIGLTGTLGLSFNNFSLRNITNPHAWTPLPSGDGQKLSLRYQSNGKFYHSYSFSFTEPWLGGKKPNNFTVSLYNSFIASGVYNPYTGFFGGSADSSFLRSTGFTVALGKRLTWPDDYFTLTGAVNFVRYTLKNYQFFYGNPLNNGDINELSLKLTLARSSVDAPIYPRSGSNIVLSGEFTPPYSLFESQSVYEGKTLAQKFKYIEYQKYRFDAEWYVPLGRPHGTDQKQFVLKLAAKYGFLGKYSSHALLSPFERFELGGDGLSNYAIYGKEIISQRGYEVYYSSDPKDNTQTQPLSYQGFTIFNKYTVELRYPITLNPSSTIFALLFFDAANGYENFQKYNPFLLRRDAGIGMRFYLPMFGLLGFDYGIGFDRMQPGQGLRNATKFSFMLGYEPE